MEPYLGEIKLFCGNYAILSWAFCDGSLLAIDQNSALFSLFGTTYGGDGITTFGLPDLRGRVPLHRSGAMPQGLMGGVEEVTLASANVAAHSHDFNATTALANQTTVASNTVAQGTVVQMFVEDVLDQQLNPRALLPAGGQSQPHENMPPYQCINYIVALEGVYPPRN